MAEIKKGRKRPVVSAGKRVTQPKQAWEQREDTNTRRSKKKKIQRKSEDGEGKERRYRRFWRWTIGDFGRLTFSDPRGSTM